MHISICWRDDCISVCYVLWYEREEIPEEEDVLMSHGHHSIESWPLIFEGLVY